MQAIIFDFGNVLGFFDHAKTLARLAPYTDMSGAEIRRLVYEGTLEDDFESGRMTLDDFSAHFRKLCRLRCDHDFLCSAVADIFEPNAALCELIPKLAPRYRLLLGSNTNPIHSRHFLRQFADILKPFHALVLSHDIGVRKPHAGFFEHCRSLAECPASECVFIDDLPANIAGARAAGLNGILYARGDDVVGALRRLGCDV